MDATHLQNIKLLKERTGGSLSWCKMAYDQAGYDMAKAERIVAERVKSEGRTFSLNPKGDGTGPKHGMVIADVNATRDLGLLLALSCKTESVAKNELFTNALDTISIVAFNEKPMNVSALLGCEIDKVKNATKGLGTTTVVYTVEDLLREISLLVKETILIEHYQLVTPGIGAGQNVILYPYQHHNGSIGSIVTFLVPTIAEGKDLEWLKRRVAAVVAGYNPLVIHEYTLPKSILKYVEEKEKEELKSLNPPIDEGDQTAVDHITNWRKSDFLKRVVLDKIDIPSEPFQEGNKPKEKNEIPMRELSVVCKANNLIVMDFARFQVEIQGSVI